MPHIGCSALHGVNPNLKKGGRVPTWSHRRTFLMPSHFSRQVQLAVQVWCQYHDGF